MKLNDKVIVFASETVPETEVKAGCGTSMQVLIGHDNAPNFAMRRFRIKSGGGMPNHTNEIEHEQFVLGGKAQVGIGDETFTVKKGDVVFIPAGVAHWYENNDKEDFSFLCLVPNKPDKINIVTNC